MDLIQELLEIDQQDQNGDPEMDQAVADINKRYSQDRSRAQAEIEKWKRARLQRVDTKTRSLLLQKDRMNKQINNQMNKQRAASPEASRV